MSCRRIKLDGITESDGEGERFYVEWARWAPQVKWGLNLQEGVGDLCLGVFGGGGCFWWRKMLPGRGVRSVLVVFAEQPLEPIGWEGGDVEWPLDFILSEKGSPCRVLRSAVTEPASPWEGGAVWLLVESGNKESILGDVGWVKGE